MKLAYLVAGSCLTISVIVAALGNSTTPILRSPDDLIAESITVFKQELERQGLGEAPLRDLIVRNQAMWASLTSMGIYCVIGFSGLVTSINACNKLDGYLNYYPVDQLVVFATGCMGAVSLARCAGDYYQTVIRKHNQEALPGIKNEMLNNLARGYGRGVQALKSETLLMASPKWSGKVFDAGAYESEFTDLPDTKMYHKIWAEEVKRYLAPSIQELHKKHRQ